MAINVKKINMLLKINIGIVGMILLIINVSNGQSVNSLDIHISLCKKSSTKVGLEITFKNNDSVPLIIYKPSLDDICNGLLYINAENGKDTFSLFPCKYKSDIQSIVLGESNIIKLKAKGVSRMNLLFNTNNFIPSLKRGKYKIILTLNYSYVVFKTKEKESIFKEKVSSRPVDFISE